MRRPRLTFDQRILLYALLAGTPALLTAMGFLWFGDYEFKVQATLTLLILGFWLGFAAAARLRVVRPLQTMANLLSALREGDFSIRARGAQRDEPLGDVYAEINFLGTLLQTQRLGALEATALLRTVMEEIDVAIFAFDSNETLRLVNRAGQELLAAPAERILGRSAAELGLKECLAGDDSRVLSAIRFPGGAGRWGMRRPSFRATNSPTPSPPSNPSPAASPPSSSTASAPPIGRTTCAPAWKSSRPGPRVWAVSCRRTRAWRNCRSRR